MTNIKTIIVTVALSALAVLSSNFAAQADTTAIWTTTSKSANVGLSIDPQVAVNGSVSAVAWMQRTGVESSKLMIRVLRSGVWGAAETLETSDWDWWDAFDVQVSSSGKVYVALQTVDVTMTVYTSTEAGIWANQVVDNTSSFLGDMTVSGTSNGTVVAFTSNRATSNRLATLSSYVFDEANSGAGWSTSTVDTFTKSDFSPCTVNRSYYDSCTVNANDSQFAIAADGSEVLFTSVDRGSASGLLPGFQFKLFKYHRANSANAWTGDGAINTLTLGKSDQRSYSFFLSNIATTSAGKYAVALTTGGSAANTLRIFTGETFASAPVASDAPFIASLKSTDSASIVSFNGSFYVAFDAVNEHKFGKVGSLSTTTTAMSQATGNQQISNLLVVGGHMVAVITTPKLATYLSTRTKTWSAKTKVLSYAGYSSPLNGTAATDGTNLLIAAPRIAGDRRNGLFAYMP
jgi:hypothetical protein